MKSLRPSSIFTANNSVPLIIFIFIFIAVGNEATEPLSKGGVSKSINNMENTDNVDSFSSDYNTVTETFQDEVGLFIKKDETRPEMYSHNPIYIPPFNTGKETRSVTRHVNRPNETNVVQSCLNSELVKVSSDASF
jgi:hypothetical protein